MIPKLKHKVLCSLGGANGQKDIPQVKFSVGLAANTHEQGFHSPLSSREVLFDFELILENSSRSLEFSSCGEFEQDQKLHFQI